MDRRKFLKLFGIGVTASIVAPSLLLKDNIPKPEFKSYVGPNGTKITIAVDPAMDGNVKYYWINSQEYHYRTLFEIEKERALLYGRFERS